MKWNDKTTYSNQESLLRKRGINEIGESGGYFYHQMTPALKFKFPRKRMRQINKKGTLQTIRAIIVLYIHDFIYTIIEMDMATRQNQLFCSSLTMIAIRKSEKKKIRTSHQDILLHIIHAIRI